MPLNRISSTSNARDCPDEEQAAPRRSKRASTSTLPSGSRLPRPRRREPAEERPVDGHYTEWTVVASRLSNEGLRAFREVNRQAARITAEAQKNVRVRSVEEMKAALKQFPLVETLAIDFPSRVASRTLHERDVRQHFPCTLKALELTNCHTLGPIGLGHLKNLPHLTQLFMMKCNIFDEAVKVISELAALQELVLTETAMRDKGAFHLSQHPNIKMLDLTYNNITDDGATHFGSNSTIEALSLNSCLITDEGAAQLSWNSTLQVLDLSYTEVTDRGAHELAESSSIKTLYLEECAVSEEAVRHLETKKINVIGLEPQN